MQRARRRHRMASRGLIAMGIGGGVALGGGLQLLESDGGGLLAGFPGAVGLFVGGVTAAAGFAVSTAANLATGAALRRAGHRTRIWPGITAVACIGLSLIPPITLVSLPASVILSVTQYGLDARTLQRHGGTKVTFVPMLGPGRRGVVMAVVTGRRDKSPPGLSIP